MKLTHGVLILVALISYLACGRIARRSPFYGGGTVVLSWIGLLVPCIAWIALFQGFTALRRAGAQAPGPQTVANMSSYTIWLVIYVASLAVGGALYGRI